MKHFEKLEINDIHYKTETEANILTAIAYSPLIALAIPAFVLIYPFIALDEMYEIEEEIAEEKRLKR